MILLILELRILESHINRDIKELESLIIIGDDTHSMTRGRDALIKFNQNYSQLAHDYPNPEFGKIIDDVMAIQDYDEDKTYFDLLHQSFWNECVLEYNDHIHDPIPKYQKYLDTLKAVIKSKMVEYQQYCDSIELRLKRLEQQPPNLPISIRRISNIPDLRISSLAFVEGDQLRSSIIDLMTGLMESCN